MAMTRRGFTLVELLVVIGVIAVLTSLLFPAAGMVRRLARDLQCSNNLRQIALGLEAYRQQFDDQFPKRVMRGLIDAGGDFTAKTFLCPHDPTAGTTVNMGRAPGWDTYERLYRNEVGSEGLALSYSIECSSRRDPALFTQGDRDYFYRNLDTTARDGLGQRSWAEGKLNQRQFGNLSQSASAGVYGAPFAASDVPIVRCYWHHEWPDSMPGGDRSFPAKVNNVTLGFNVKWSIPFWELEINPLLK
jgi:prepilin-type N-terminal cleavage/methylation domain-containing protein